jgi:hypothetical protein
MIPAPTRIHLLYRNMTYETNNLPDEARWPISQLQHYGGEGRASGDIQLRPLLPCSLYTPAKQLLITDVE